MTSKTIAILTDVTSSRADAQLVDADELLARLDDISDTAIVAYVPEGTQDGERVYRDECVIIADVGAELADVNNAAPVTEDEVYDLIGDGGEFANEDEVRAYFAHSHMVAVFGHEAPSAGRCEDIAFAVVENRWFMADAKTTRYPNTAAGRAAFANDYLTGYERWALRDAVARTDDNAQGAWQALIDNRDDAQWNREWNDALVELFA